MKNRLTKLAKKYNSIKIAKNLYITLSECEDKKIYTKTSRRDSQTKQLRDLNELLFTELGKQIGLKMLEYMPFRQKEIQSILSYNFLLDGEELFKPVEAWDAQWRAKNSYCNFRYYKFSEIIESLQKYKEAGFDVPIDNIAQKLFEILVLDLITLQTDRNCNNQPFIINKEKRYIKLGPLFDNEYAFFLSNSNIFFKINEVPKALVDRKHYMKELIESYDEEFKYILAIKNGAHYRNRIKDCVEFVKNNPQMKAILDNILNNLNIQEAFKQLKQKGISVNKHYIEWCTSIVEYGKTLFNKELENLKTQEKNI